jgi:ferritin-like protein
VAAHVVAEARVEATRHFQWSGSRLEAFKTGPPRRQAEES